MAGPNNVLNATNTTGAGTFYPVFVQTAGPTTPYIRSSATAFSFNPGTGEVSAVDFNSLSDQALKTNIQPLEDAASIINKLQAVSFDWKGLQKQSFGFIAQDVEKILPNVVTTTGEGKAMSYLQLIPFLVSALQQQQQQIAELQKSKI